MNLFRVSLRNLRLRLLSTSLTTLSIAVGAGMVAALWLLIAETEKRYTTNTQGYRAIIGPKEGSPLSLVLSTVFNLGIEPGVVPLSVYKELHEGDLARRLGLVYAIPQARGDTFGGFPIIGTTSEMFTEFRRGKDEFGEYRMLDLAEGEAWTFDHAEFLAFAEHLAEHAAEVAADGGEHNHEHEPLPDEHMAAVIGSAVADRLGLELGSEIVPVHGRADEAVVAHKHEDSACRVVAIMAETGGPLDRSIFIPMDVFMSMDKHDAIRPGQDAASDSVLISAIIVEARARLAEFHLRNAFQTRTDAQAASPSIEMRQLLEMVGDATMVLRVTVYLVLFVAGISVMVALYNTMNERRREIAIMRSLGARRHQILRIILQEALLIAFLGGGLGVLLCHVSAYFFAPLVSDISGVMVDWRAFSVDELWLILGTCVLGGFAGILPAIKGSLVEVADNLGPVS